MRESTYTAAVRKEVLPVYALKISLRHESGVADSWYSGQLGDLWAEYKWYAKLPRVIDLLKGKKPKLSKLQQEWLEARFLEGRNVCVIVASHEGAVVLPGLEWKTPLTLAQFKARAVSRKELAQFITEFVSGTKH